MKKIITILMSCIFLFGCSCADDNAKMAVMDYLNQYKNLSDEVLNDLDSTTNEQDFTDKQKETYKDIMKKQYQDLKYEITDEKYNGDTAVITAKITVYDLYKAEENAKKYLQDNPDKFNDDSGAYSIVKYIEYKLEQMLKNTDTTTYTIDFLVTKENDTWTVEQPSQSDLEKIHGIYKYE